MQGNRIIGRYEYIIGAAGSPFFLGRIGGRGERGFGAEDCGGLHSKLAQRVGVASFLGRMGGRRAEGWGGGVAETAAGCNGL